MSDKKKSVAIENEKKKLFQSIKFAIGNDLVVHLFNDLLWGIIRFLENRKEDALVKFREFVDHCHKVLFNKLNLLLQRPLHLDYDERNDASYVLKLKTRIFPELNIKNTVLLGLTRETFKDGSLYLHDYHANKVKPIEQIFIPHTIIGCVKLFLLVNLIIRLPKKVRINKNCEKDIEKEYPIVFQIKDKKIILDIFLEQVFSEIIKNKILEKKLITPENIENSKILQKYYPFIVLDYLKIQNTLNSEKIEYFRPDGPHLIDFEKGNWVHIPFLTPELIKCLRLKNQSILLEGESGTGKTVISRYIGYELLKNGFKIFYINCLDHKPKKIDRILDYLTINYFKFKPYDKTLFIFENIHILKKGSINKFKTIKYNLLCLITRRIFKTEKDDDEDISIIFRNDEIFRLNKDSNDYLETIKGILRLNNVSDNNIKHLLSSVIFENLWMLGIFLKLTLKKDDKSSFFDSLTDFEKLEDEFTTYFQKLMKSKHLKYKTADELVFLNHLKYFLSIVSIFSDLEIWVEDSFIYDLLNYIDDSLLDELKINLSYDEDVLKKIISFLIEILEIQVSDSKSKKGHLQKEYKIPHSQLAKIYKNSFLSIFEENYNGFTKKIINRYVFKGKYFGSFLYRQSRLIYSKFLEDYREAEHAIVGKFNEFYIMLKDQNSSLYYPEGLNLIRNQILDNPLEEVQLFLDALPYNLPHDQENVLYEKIFKLIFNEETLFNQKWNKKLIRSNFKGIYYFMCEILDFLGNNMFKRFLAQFSNQIIEKFEQSDEILLLNLIFLLLESPEEVFNKYYKSVRNSWSGKGLTFENFISLDLRARQRLLNIDNNHPKYDVIKSLIVDSFRVSFIKEDLRFFYKEDKHKLFIEIYLEFLNTPSNKTFIQNKVGEVNLRDYNNLITILHDIEPNLSKNIFLIYHEKLREKILYANWWIFTNFLSELQFLDYDKDLLEEILLKDWDWFKNVLNKFPYENFKFCTIKLEPFFKNYFTQYYEIYKETQSEILKEKIKSEYDSLPNKEEIIQLVDERSFYFEINDFILNLFIDSLFNRIKERKLDYIIQIFKIFEGYNQKIISKKFILENLNLRKLLTYKRLITLIEKASNEEIVDLFNSVKIFKDGDKIFYEINQHLLLLRFGPNFVDLLNYNKVGRQFFTELPLYIQNLDLEKIVLIFNSTLDNPEDNLYLKLNTLITESNKLFVGENFKEKLFKITASTLLNFLIIIDLYHSDLFFEIKNKFHYLFKPIFKSNILEIGDLLELFIIFNINSEYFKKLDLKLFNEPILFSKVQKSFQELDLFSLRYIINFYIDHNMYDKISNFIDHLDLIGIIQNSSLLEYSLGSFAFLMNVVSEEAKIGPPRYVNDYNFKIVNDEDYDRLTRYVDYLMIQKYRPKEKLKRFMVSGYGLTEINVILEKINPFSMNILNKLEGSTLTEIFFYLQSIISLKRVFRNKIFNPTAQFYDFFFSNNFSDLLGIGFFNKIYEFFQCFQLLDSFKAKGLWIKNQSVLECEALFRECDLFKIIELLFMVYNENTNSISFKTTRLLKKKILEIEFPGIMRLFQRLEIKILDFALSILKNEIHKIVSNLSKYDLLEEFEPNESHILFKDIFADKFNLIKERIPIIKRKFEEKYIHE